MVTIIKKGSSPRRIKKALQTVKKPQKTLRAKIYCGLIKLPEDALEIQKKLRNEWK